MKIYILTILAIVTISTAHGNEYSDSIAVANNYYTQGEFEKAINAYQYVIASGYEAPNLYYNLGNSYYKLYKNTLAIYYYEKALRLSPNNEDIQHNLEVANTFIVDKIDAVPVFFLKRWIKNLSRKMSRDGWAYLSVGSFIGVLLVLMLFLFSRKASLKKIAFAISVLLFLVSLISFGFANKQNQWLTGGKEAIVYSPSVNVKSSPDNNGTDIFILHEGIKVVIVETFDSWNEIEIPDGRKGWIKISDLLII